MSRKLTSPEKKELKNWASENNVNLSHNPELNFGNGFWEGEDVSNLKLALLERSNLSQFNFNARMAVGSDNFSFDADCSIIGNKKGLTLISCNGVEAWVNFNNLKYVNGFLAVPKSLIK